MNGKLNPRVKQPGFPPFAPSAPSPLLSPPLFQKFENETVLCLQGVGG
jgi:hypothetical protein